MIPQLIVLLCQFLPFFEYDTLLVLEFEIHPKVVAEIIPIMIIIKDCRFIEKTSTRKS